MSETNKPGWIMLPESYQPDTSDSRAESGLKYARYYHESAFKELQDDNIRLQYESEAANSLGDERIRKLIAINELYSSALEEITKVYYGRDYFVEHISLALKALKDGRDE